MRFRPLASPLLVLLLAACGQASNTLRSAGAAATDAAATPEMAALARPPGPDGGAAREVVAT